MNDDPIDLSRLLHLRYKPARENFKGCGECPAFDCFDWVIWKPDAKTFLRSRKLFPKTILCLAHRESLQVLSRFRFLLRGVTLVVAGEDTNLSALRDEIDRLSPHCKRIHFEAKDIDHPVVRSFSMGFISYYLKRLGEDLLRECIARVRSGAATKQGVLVAWGAIWKVLDDQLDERKMAARFVEESDWLHRQELTPPDYVRALVHSRYLLAPAGAGVQAPKLAEAWLFHVVPIVIRNPCFEDLAGMGYPMVMLNCWEDLTEDLLAAKEPWRDSIDWKQVDHMLTIDHFQQHCLGQ